MLRACLNLAGMGNVQKTLRVDVAAAPYDVLIGHGLLASAGTALQGRLPRGRVLVVTDENVAPLYLDALQAGLAAAGLDLAAPFVLKTGESAKNFADLEKIIDHAIAQGLDRHAVFIALGGGVVGDVAGFAAAIFMRGVACVQVPTTLAAQVDSAVGGKTAVNTALGKNMAGVFHQPRAVLADVAVLKTLPPREVLAGYAEILKYALIDKPDFFSWLEANGATVVAGWDAPSLEYAVAVSCAAKADIVAADEKETTGRRALLNLGHTFAHALEALGGYDGRLLHGEAVAIGLRWATLLSQRLGYLPAADSDRILAHMDALSMPVNLPFAVKAAEIIEKMRRDKKAENGKITLILLRGIGAAYVDKDIDEETLAAFLRQLTEE